MQSEKSYRGWIVVLSVASLITYFVLAVEQDSRLSQVKNRKSSSSDRLSGIWVNEDPSVKLSQLTRPGTLGPTASANDRSQRTDHADTANLMSTPPEPVATVVLHAPTAIPDMVALSLTDANENDKLISAIDHAFDSPMRTVSTQRAAQQAIESTIDDSRLQELMPKGIVSSQLPEPVTLMRDLAALRMEDTNSTSSTQTSRAQDSPNQELRSQDRSLQSMGYVVTRPMMAVQSWSLEVEARMRRLLTGQALLSPRVDAELEDLLALTAQAHTLAADLDSVNQSARLGAVAYGVERRVRVWQAVAMCLRTNTAAVTTYTADQVARERLYSVADRIHSDLEGKADGAAWKKFLRISELLEWCSDAEADWQRGNELATTILTRLNWERLTAAQRQFLTGQSFEELSDRLAPWAAQPVDFKQLLSDIEQLEEDPINRCRVSLAHTVQTLRVSPQPAQRAVAEAINDHYRNANIRLAVSGKLLERMMPNETFEARPVRQRILGADTQGNSQVRTSLAVRLIPDPSAWHLELGVKGNMESATRSSKGPAVFHQTSIAKIDSARILRMDASGIKVTAQPTNVDASQYLNGMSTDLDRMPVVGDFFRAIVREQFEQQRGLAQRITRRLIAEETDQEVDKQLKQKLSGAESQLQHTFIGPLERLQLNPIVVAMNTTPERLTIRYRVANDSQMAAHTARPRAPGDALVSMQIHQSAINNSLAQLSLSERTWTLPELCDKLADVFDQSPWTLPEDTPKDVTVRFAATRPITVELRDGKLEMTLRIAELNHPERKMNFQRFIIRASYVPVANGLQAALVRDGVVSVDGPRLGFGEKVPLRGIFGTVFAARSSLNLIHSGWLEDPRAEGLAVSQVEVRDGWLSIAVSDSASPHAAKVAEVARTLSENTER